LRREKKARESRIVVRGRSGGKEAWGGKGKGKKNGKEDPREKNLQKKRLTQGKKFPPLEEKRCRFKTKKKLEIVFTQQKIFPKGGEYL